MRIGLLYYEGFVEFEIALACVLFSEHDIISLALEDKVYVSEGKQRFVVDHVLGAVEPESLDLLIIPGGDSKPLYDNKVIRDFIEEMDRHGKKVAGICGGAVLLAQLGFLRGKRCTGNTSGIKPEDSAFKYYSGSTLVEEHVVMDGNFITAQGQAYAEFAVNLMQYMGQYDSQEAFEAELRWVKNER